MNNELVLIEKIKSYIKEEKNKDIDVNLQSKIVDDLDLDSLDLVEINFLIQEELNINIEFDQFFSCKLTEVNDILILIKNHDALQKRG